MSKQDPRYENFRKLMRNLRKEQGITQLELASRLGKPQSYVSKYESGDRNIDVIEWLDIIKALGINATSTICYVAEALEKI